VGIADEIVVVDSGSTDRTAEIASVQGVSFFERSFTNHADQKNYAASRASNDWIFLLDADEELSSELRNSLLEWKQSEPEFQVYENGAPHVVSRCVDPSLAMVTRIFNEGSTEKTS